MEKPSSSFKLYNHKTICLHEVMFKEHNMELIHTGSSYEENLWSDLTYAEWVKKLKLYLWDSVNWKVITLRHLPWTDQIVQNFEYPRLLNFFFCKISK